MVFRAKGTAVYRACSLFKRPREGNGVIWARLVSLGRGVWACGEVTPGLGPTPHYCVGTEGRAGDAEPSGI